MEQVDRLSPLIQEQPDALAAHPPADSGEPARAWHAETRIYSYTEAANPVRHGLTEPIPLRSWSSRLTATAPAPSSLWI